MITIRKKADLPEAYPLDRLGPPEQILFFDIETTGFSGDHSSLYLIGCAYREHGAWTLIQWLADTEDSEEQLLCEFFQLLKRFRYLIHFNGEGFDIPFLLKRCRSRGLPADRLSQFESIDIYRKIRPLKKLLGLESLKQKSLERFLGVSRTDRYSGGELVKVYLDYLTSKDPECLRLLLLHNEEDLQGMLSILSVLCYPDFLEQGFTLTESSVERDGSAGSGALLRFESPVSIPVPLTIHRPPVLVCAKQNRLTVRLSLYEGELKYFFPDYKDYYYLIYEDTAIHKSVAEYVDRGVKRKAAAKDCYAKRLGRFLPIYGSLPAPVFQKEYREKERYMEYQDEFFQDPSNAGLYLRQLLKHLLS